MSYTGETGNDLLLKGGYRDRWVKFESVGIYPVLWLSL